MISTYFSRHLNALTDCSRIVTSLRMDLSRELAPREDTFLWDPGTDRRTVKHIDRCTVARQKTRNSDEKDNSRGIRGDKECTTMGIAMCIACRQHRLTL